MTYQEFVKEYVGLDEDLIDEICKNLPCLKQITIDNIRVIQLHPNDGFRNLLFKEIKMCYKSISGDCVELIFRAISNICFPFCDFTKISQELTDLEISSDVVLKLYLNLRKIYLKICGYDK